MLFVVTDRNTFFLNEKKSQNNDIIITTQETKDIIMNYSWELLFSQHDYENEK